MNRGASPSATRTRLFASAGVVVAVAITAVSVASGGPSATKQRVAIEAKLVVVRDGVAPVTFKLIPLSSGDLQADSGKFSAMGSLGKPKIDKNGQTVSVITGSDTYVGANGTLKVAQRTERTQAAQNYFVDTGTWKVISGTGVYQGYRGGGGYTAVLVAAKGTYLLREEGYLSNG